MPRLGKTKMTNLSTETQAPTGKEKLQFEVSERTIAAGTDRALIEDTVLKAIEGLDEKDCLTNVDQNEGFNTSRAILLREYVDTDGDKLACAVIEVPTLEELMSTPEGVEFVRKAVLSPFNRKFSAVIGGYLRGDRKQSLTLPKSLSDFITSTASVVDVTERKRFSYDAWNAYKADIRDMLVAAFAKKNINVSISYADLEECLANQQIASIKLSAIAGTLFDAIVARLVSLPPVHTKDKKTGKTRTDNGDLFKFWSETRNVKADTLDVSLDLEDLDVSKKA